MNNEKILYGVVGLVLGAVLTGGMMNMMGIRSSTMHTGNIDLHFIDQMIPHHEDAITMAQLALQKAEHQEIKDLAQNIITVQDREIKQMQEWRKRGFSQGWIPEAQAHGMEHGLNMGMMGNNSDLEDLENAQPFDKKFIEEMIPHHQMAVMMAQMLWNTTQREEMKKFANDIVTAQTQEINQMRQWYQTWYQK